MLEDIKKEIKKLQNIIVDLIKLIDDKKKVIKIIHKHGGLRDGRET